MIIGMFSCEINEKLPSRILTGLEQTKYFSFFVEQRKNSCFNISAKYFEMGVCSFHLFNEKKCEIGFGQS